MNKVLIKPNTAPKNHKLRQSSGKKQFLNFLDVSQKYLKYKKSASLPNKLSQKDKLGRIMRIYTNLANNDIQNACKSISKSKSKNSLRSHAQKSIHGFSLGKMNTFSKNNLNQINNNANNNLNNCTTKNQNQYFSTQFHKQSNIKNSNLGVLNANSTFLNTNTKRLSLHNVSTNKFSNAAFNSVSAFPINSSQIMNTIDKLQEILKCKMDKLFQSSFQSFTQQMHKNLGPKLKTQNVNLNSSKKDSFSSTFNADRMKTTSSGFNQNYNFSSINNQNIVPCLFKLLQDCFERIYTLKFAQVRQNYEQSRSQISSELNKHKIKLTILNQKLEQNERKVQEAQKIIKKNEQKNMITIGFNTQFEKNKEASSGKLSEYSFQHSKQTIKAQQNNPLNTKQLLKKIRLLQTQHKQLISVMILLKKQGVNIEKAYEDVVRCMNNKKQSKKQQSKNSSGKQLNQQNFLIKNQNTENQFLNSSQSEEDSECYIKANLFKIPKIKNKMKMKQQKPKILYQNDSQNQADQSIISTIQAMSFNYQGQQPQADIFTSRVQFQQQKELDPLMKNKLKLDFHQMIQDQEQKGFLTV